MGMSMFGQLADRRMRKAVTEWKNDFKPLSLKEVWSMDLPPSQWKIHGLVPEETLTIISGAPASFKTWLIFQMAVDISLGKSFLGQFPCKPGKILMIDEESHLRLIKDRFIKLGATEELPIHFLSQQQFSVLNEKMITSILDICKKLSIDTLFIDSLVRIHSVDENSSGDMKTVLQQLRTFIKEGITVIVTHHERKESPMAKSSPQNRARGSSEILANADSLLTVHRVKDDKHRLVFEQAKNREAEEIPAFEIKVVSEGETVRFEFLGDHDGGKQKKEEAKEIILTILEENPEGLKKGEIATSVKELSGIGQSSTYTGLNELIQEGLVEVRQGVGRTLVCFLKLKSLAD